MFGVRLLIILLLMEAWMFYGLEAVGAGGGEETGKMFALFGTTNGENESQTILVEANESSSIAPINAIFSVISVGIGTIIKFLQLLWGVATIPYHFMDTIGMPQPIPLMFGLVYNIGIVATIAQFITGRALA